MTIELSAEDAVSIAYWAERELQYLRDPVFYAGTSEERARNIERLEALVATCEQVIAREEEHAARLARLRSALR